MAKKFKFFSIATVAAIAGVAASGIISNDASAVGGATGLAACEAALKALDGTTATYGGISAEAYGEQHWKEWVYQDSFTEDEEVYYKATIAQAYKDEVVINYVNHKLRQDPVCAEYLGEHTYITPDRNGAIQGKASFYMNNAGPLDSSWKTTLNSLESQYEVRMPILDSGSYLVTGNKDKVIINIKAKNTSDLNSYNANFIKEMHAVNYVFYGTSAVDAIFNFGETMNSVLNLKQYTDIMAKYPRAEVEPLYYLLAGGMGAASTIDRSIGNFHSIFVDDTYFSFDSFYATYAPVLVAPESTKDLEAFVKSQVSLPEGARLKSFKTEKDPGVGFSDGVEEKIKAELGSTAKLQPNLYVFNYDDSARFSGLGADDMTLVVAVFTVSDEAYKTYSDSEKVIVNTDVNTGVGFETSASNNIPKDAELFSKDVKNTTKVTKALKKATEKIVAAFDLSLYSLTRGNISKFDSPITVRVPVDAKYASHKLVARYITEDGKTPEADITVKIVKNGDKYYAEFAVKHFSVYALVDNETGSSTLPTSPNAGYSDTAGASTSLVATLTAAIATSLAIVLVRRKADKNIA